jgi:tetratricopeptide (TPR) repeat protein
MVQVKRAKEKSTRATGTMRRPVTSNASPKPVTPVSDWADFEMRLQRVNSGYKQALFTPELRENAVQLWRFLRDKGDLDETSAFWKAYTLLYELNDLFQFDSNIKDEAFKLGEIVYDELRSLSVRLDTSEIPLHERKLAREKVLYCSCRGNELKRRGKTVPARELFEWLLEFTINKLQTNRFPCLGTQARLTYHLGSIYRILDRHDEAEDLHAKTLELLYERSKLPHDADERTFMIRRQAMTIGFGFGWVNASRGSLKSAENSLLTARSLLAGINDPVVPSYIELLYGITKRCRAGSNKVKLQEAVESLISARSAFELAGNSRYVPAACWELSLALNLLGRFSEAQENLNKVREYAEKTEIARWLANVRTQQSRILRNQGDYKRALREAEEAVRIGNDCNLALPLTTAYIARGEAKLRLPGNDKQSEIDYKDARRDFEIALQKLKSSATAEKILEHSANPKIVGICELRIAQCYAREGDDENAKLHFSRWELLRERVEHELVREIGAEVKSEIDKLLMNFTISGKESSEWNYITNVTRLRNWLLTRALRHTKRNYSAAAELLGVKRGTLYQWQDASRNRSQRARTRA